MSAAGPAADRTIGIIYVRQVDEPWPQWDWLRVDRAALRWWIDLGPKKRQWYFDHPYTAIKWSQWFDHINLLMNIGSPDEYGPMAGVQA